MNAIRLNMIRVISALGFLASLLLVVQHIRFVNGGGEFGFCRIAKLFDCAAIESSAFSAIGGVPTASFGMIYFLGVFAMAWFSNRGPRFQAVGSLVSLVGLSISLVLALISALVIQKFCLGCTAIYFLTLGLALLFMEHGVTEYLASVIEGTPVGLRMIREIFASNDSASRGTFRIVAMSFCLVVVPSILFSPRLFMRESSGSVELLEFRKSPVFGFTDSNPGMARGPIEAKVKIVIFTDFDCTYCKSYKPVLDELLKDHPAESYRMIYKHYPMGKCNPIMKGQPKIHEHACRLAEMAQALAEMNKFWDMGGELYQLAGTTEIYPGLKSIAEKGGIHYGQWVASLERPSIREKINADLTEGVKLGIRALPAIFVNGRYASSLKPEVMKIILDDAFSHE